MEGDVKSHFCLICFALQRLHAEEKKEPDKNQCNTEKLHKAVANRNKMEKKSQLELFCNLPLSEKEKNCSLTGPTFAVQNDPSVLLPSQPCSGADA